MIKVFFLCKNNRFFSTLEDMLNKEGISIAGTCSEPQNALEHFIKSKADLVVMDANWSGYSYTMSSEQIMQRFLKHDENIKVIFVTLHFEPNQIEDIKRLGAKGYIYRNVSKFEKITNCIKQVFWGDAVYNSELV